MRVNVPGGLAKQVFVEQVVSEGCTRIALGYVERCSGDCVASCTREWARVAGLALKSTASGDPAEVLAALSSWHTDLDLRGDIIHLLTLIVDVSEDLVSVCCAGDFSISGTEIGSYSAPLGSPTETLFDVEVIAAGDFSVGFGPRSLTLAEVVYS